MEILNQDPKFVNDISEDFVCTICTKVLNDAYQAKCSCQYCRSCIESQIAKGNEFCPGNSRRCGSTKVNMTSIVPNYITNKKIENLQIECLHGECRFVCTISEIEDHMRSCEYGEAQCVYTFMGCSLSGVSVKEMKKHLVDAALDHATLFATFAGQLRDNVEEGRRQREGERLRLEELRTQMEATMNAAIADERRICKDEMKKQQNKLGEMENKQKNMKKEIDKQQKKIEEMEKQQKNMKNEMEKQQKKIEVMENKQKKIKKVMDKQQKIKEETENQQKNMKNEMEKQQKKIEEMEKQQKNTKDEMEKQQKKIEEMEKQQKNMKDEMEEEKKKKKEEELKQQKKSEEETMITRQFAEFKKTLKPGEMVWKIDKVTKKRADVRNGGADFVLSGSFFSQSDGYKLRMLMYPDGDGSGKGDHLGLFVSIIRGINDDIVSWPCKKRFSLQLLNMDTGESHTTLPVFDLPAADCGKKPSTERNISIGIPEFISWAELNRDASLKKNDSIIVKCSCF